MPDFLNIPSNVRQQYIPFVISPESRDGKLQIFSFKKNPNYTNSCQIFPFSRHLSKLIEYDSSILYTHGPNKEKRKITYEEILNAIPALQIREYVPDARLTQSFKWLSFFKKGFETGLGNFDIHSLSDELKGEYEKVRNSIEIMLRDLTSGSAPLLVKIVGNLYKKYYTDMAFNVGDDAGYAVLFVPFLLYYCLTTTTTNNVYELPYSFNNDIMNSDGTYGWNGGNSSDMSFSNDFFKSVGDNKLVKLIAGNTIKVNLMPGFDPSSEAKSQTITINIELINDSEEAAVNNFLMCHTLFGNNRWLQYGFVQTGSSLYDIKLPGANRYFMCSGSFSCKGKGVFRTPSDAVIKEILNHTATTYNAKTIYGKKGKNGLTLRENLIKSNVELRIKEVLPPPTNKDDNGNNSSGNTSNGTTEGNTSEVTKRTLINWGGLGGTQSPWWENNKKPSTSTPSKPSDENTPEIEPIKPSTSIIITESDYKKHCEQTFVGINNNANTLKLNSTGYSGYGTEDTEKLKLSLNGNNKKDELTKDEKKQLVETIANQKVNVLSSNLNIYYQKQVTDAERAVYEANKKLAVSKTDYNNKCNDYALKTATASRMEAYSQLLKTNEDLNKVLTVEEVQVMNEFNTEFGLQESLQNNSYYKLLEERNNFKLEEPKLISAIEKLESDLNSNKYSETEKLSIKNNLEETKRILKEGKETYDKTCATLDNYEEYSRLKNGEKILETKWDNLNDDYYNYQKEIAKLEKIDEEKLSKEDKERLESLKDKCYEIGTRLTEINNELNTVNDQITNFEQQTGITKDAYGEYTETIEEFNKKMQIAIADAKISERIMKNAESAKKSDENKLAEAKAALESAKKNLNLCNKFIEEETAKVDEIINNIEVKEVNSDYLKSLIKIPDVYSLTLTFNSLIPDNFNNYIFGFRAGNLDPLTNWNENSVRTGIYEEFANKLTEVLGKLKK